LVAKSVSETVDHPIGVEQQSPPQDVGQIADEQRFPEKTVKRCCRNHKVKSCLHRHKVPETFLAQLTFEFLSFWL